MRQLVIDSTSKACSVALIDAGELVDWRHEVIGRGHAERLVPLVAELDGGGRADAVYAGCGPGSFAGVRIGVAAARALALGWSVAAQGFSSLALVAAGAADELADTDGALVVMEGGHGQWFVQRFGPGLSPRSEIFSLYPDDAVRHDDALIVGNRAEAFVAQRGSGRAIAMLPDARNFARLPDAAFSDTPTPIYGRAPDAKPMATS